MNGRPRKASVPVEATQELQALDVLEIVEALKPTGGAKPRRPTPSNSSIAPVGLDLAPDVSAGGDEEVNPTMEVHLPHTRRRLGGVVIGALAGCALILLAAVIARAGHASTSGDTAVVDSPGQTSLTTTAVAPAAAPPAATTAPSPALPIAPAPIATATGNASATSSTGTVRLDRPAAPGRVWLDGKKLGASSALVSCDTHQVRVGRGRTHSIDVPCGGEIGVSR